MREDLIDLADSLLDDDHGITTHAYACLLQAFHGERAILDLLDKWVDGTDGRVYYKSGFVGLRDSL